MNKDSSDRTVVAIAIAIIAIIVAGEVIVYTSDYTDYSAEVEFKDNGLDFSVSAHGSKDYSIVVSQNGGYSAVKRVYLYFDDTYPSDYVEVVPDVGAPALDQAYYLQQVKALLEYRHVSDVVYADAQELEEILSKDIRDGAIGAGLVCISGVLPDTVYTGNEGDVLMRWLDAGGSLYWAGNLIGCQYGTENGIVQVNGYQELFFGSECLNLDGPDKAYEDYSGNAYRQALSLSCNYITYAVDPSKVTGRDCIGLGYEGNGYASITATQYGAGAIFVFGGDYSNYQRYDMVQVLASGVGPWSSIITVESGNVTRGTVSGSIEIDATDVSAYVYLGGYYPVYGRYFGS